MSSGQARPTEAELTILQVLWDRGPLSVRGVFHVLNVSKTTGYTTVLKTMQIMTEKGLLERDESQRPQIYRSSYSQQQTQRQMVRHLVQRVFGGSVRSLVLQALATKKSSPEEIAAIEKLLDRVKGGEK
jgi:Predicted transcriptional regulator